jgi:hypothetical protein
VGALIYGTPAAEFEFDDRILAHLQVVFGAKLRRGESFMFSWQDSPTVGNGRSAAWIDPAIPLYFRYSGGRVPVLNREWLEALSEAAGSSQGLVLFSETDPKEAGRADDNSIKRKDHPSH